MPSPNTLFARGARAFIARRLKLTEASAQAMTDADCLRWQRRIEELDRGRTGQRSRLQPCGKGIAR